MNCGVHNRAMPQTHAPKGGVTIHGKHYVGGEFIPADVLNSLDSKDLDKLSRPSPVPDQLGDENPERLEIQKRWITAYRDNQDNPSLEANAAERESYRQFQAHDAAVQRVAHAARMERFADEYFSFDEKDDRINHFLEAIDDDIQPFSAALLDEDTRAAIIEDMKNWSKHPDDWNTSVYKPLKNVDDHLDWGGSNYSNTEFAVDLLASAGNRPFPLRGDLPELYAVIDTSECEPEERELLQKALAGIGATFASADGSVYVLEGDAEGGLGGGDFGEDHFELDSEEGLQKLFPHLGSPSIPEYSVPPSSRNVGRVSGGLSESIDASDFDPNAVDVYRPLSKSWYVLRRGTHSAEVADGEATYELVARKDLPPRTGLPEVYWQGLEAHDPGTVDQEAIDAKASRDHDLRGVGTNVYRRRSARESFRHLDRQYGRLKNQHNEIDGTWRSVQAHEEAANALYTEYEHDSDNPMSAELDQALERAYLAELPDEPPEFNAERARKIFAEAQDRRERDQNAVLDTAEESSAEAEEAYSDLRGELDDTAQVFREHLGERKQQWADIAEAARQYRDAGGDPEQASRIITVADRMHRRIKG
jgi:hypothetical protein